MTSDPEIEQEMLARRDFDLAKRFRIIERNRRVNEALLRRAEQRQLNMIGLGTLGSVAVLAVLIWGVFYVALAR